MDVAVLRQGLVVHRGRRPTFSWPNQRVKDDLQNHSCGISAKKVGNCKQTAAICKWNRFAKYAALKLVGNTANESYLPDPN